jgi:hypothetical protein
MENDGYEEEQLRECLPLRIFGTTSMPTSAFAQIAPQFFNKEDL